MIVTIQKIFFIVSLFLAANNFMTSNFHSNKIKEANEVFIM